MTCDYGRWVHSNSLADLRGEMNGILFLFLPIESLAWPDIKTGCRAPLKILHFSSPQLAVCVARPGARPWLGLRRTFERPPD